VRLIQLSVLNEVFFSCRQNRHRVLWEQFHFECKCEACENDYPKADYTERYANTSYLVEEIGLEAAQALGN